MPATSEEGRTPPAIPPQFKWKKNSAEVKVWEYLWGSPTAAHWDDSEAITVARYVELVSAKGRFSLGGGYVSGLEPYRLQTSIMPEIRNLEDRLALSVKTRQQLGLVNVSPEPEPTETEAETEIDRKRAARAKRMKSA